MADESVCWSSVVGEYGLLLTEMGTMKDLLTPIKSSSRIKYTCITASKKYIAMGSSTGGLYVFDRLTLKHLRFISTKDGAVHMVCLSTNQSLLGVATSLGVLLVWELGSRRRDKPKFLRRSEEHKGTTVTALCWDVDEVCLFAGDDKGVVSVVHIPLSGKHIHSPNNRLNKGLALLRPSQVVAKAQTPIVQLDCVAEKLLVSTTIKTAVVDLTSLDCVTVGVKPREGLYGSCFFKESNSENLVIYSARPGSRLWEATIDGQVMSTQQYKRLLSTRPVPLLGHGHSVAEPSYQGCSVPQSVNFVKLLLIRNRFLVTWNRSCLYILDPILGQLVAWYALDTEVQDICCVDAELYVYDAKSCVKWYSLLYVKECLSRLYGMGEIKQCLQVLLDCKQYIIPGSARDFVPISMVSSLKESLCENDNQQEVISRLEELEHEMEPAALISDDLPSYHGSTTMIGTPDTVSTFSDGLTNDEEAFVTASDPGIGAEVEGRNTESTNITYDDSHALKTGFHQKLGKQWSADVSLEGMLMSAAAAAARKFTKERQKGTMNVKRTQSVDSSDSAQLFKIENSERRSLALRESRVADQTQVIVDSEGNVTPDFSGDLNEVWRERIKEEGTVQIQKMEAEVSPDHSDDSESRQSGNEGVGLDEEAETKKEKMNLKERRKKKKRVVTVDIDSPQFRHSQEVSMTRDILLARSVSFRGTYSAFENTEVKQRRLSDPHKVSSGNVQLEIAPAIPAMLSRAKGLLRKKLKSADEYPSPSPTSYLRDNVKETFQEESAVTVLKCPPDVEHLIQCSGDTRSKVKDPLILFTIYNLRKVLEEWIPKLHAAMKSCKELSKTSEHNSQISLAGFLDQEALDNVSHLARMCFDTAIYGNSESLKELTCYEKTNSKKCPDSLGFVHDCGLSADHGDISYCESSYKSVSKMSRGSLENGVIENGYTQGKGAILPEDAPNSSCDVLDRGAAKRELFALVGISQSEIPTEAEQSVAEIVWHESTANEFSTPASNIVSVLHVTPAASTTQDGTAVSAKADVENLGVDVACDAFSGDIGDRGKPLRQLVVVNGGHQVTEQGADDSFYRRDERVTSFVHESYESEGLSEQSRAGSINRQRKNISKDSSGISRQANSRRLDPLLDHELECKLCQSQYTFLHRQESGTDVVICDFENHHGSDLDITRSMFLSSYFFLLDVKQVRRTLYLSKGDRRRTWKTLVNCLQALITTDDISRYITEGDTRRALHELHNEMEKYSDSLLYHLTCIYESDRHETMIACARMFPDVHPWEVMAICRHCKAHSLESCAAAFVLYVEQLMRWRAESGIAKEQTASQICEDLEVANWWFHCVLVTNCFDESLHCHCGLPRPGSHMLPWQQAYHLGRVIDFLQQLDPQETTVFMGLCWKHGYWTGLIRLYVWAGLRKEALKLVVHLGDVTLIKDPQEWGLLPKFLHEWSQLLELLLAPCNHGENQRMCKPPVDCHLMPDLTWENVIHLMLERLGAGHTVKLLMAVSVHTPTLTKEFYYSCLLGAVIEKRQRILIHELLKKLDSYLWSHRTGSLAPKLNMFRKEEQTAGPKSKEDSKPNLESMARVRTLEDGACNWGQNIRLSDAQCLVCSLQLCEQISTNNQGVLLFECGHVFHKYCVPEGACVVCFQQNLKTVGRKIS